MALQTFRGIGDADVVAELRWRCMAIFAIQFHRADVREMAEGDGLSLTEGRAQSQQKDNEKPGHPAHLIKLDSERSRKLLSSCC